MTAEKVGYIPHLSNKGSPVTNLLYHFSYQKMTWQKSPAGWEADSVEVREKKRWMHEVVCPYFPQKMSPPFICLVFALYWRLEEGAVSLGLCGPPCHHTRPTAF